MAENQTRKILIQLICLLIAILIVGNAAAVEHKESVSEVTLVETDETNELIYYDLDQFAADPIQTEAEQPEGPPVMLNAVWPDPASEHTELPVLEIPPLRRLTSLPVTSGKMTVEELRAKFPEGKYWNHADNPGAEPERSNPDGWTDIPCPYHNDNDDGYFRSGICTCNFFYLDGVSQGGQCHGFSAKLAYDVTGKSLAEWAKIDDAKKAMSVVKPGDVIRINNDHHTIFVIAVRNDEIMYADCNNGSQCAIHWNQRMSKQDIINNFTLMYQSPVTLAWGGAGACWCSGTAAGQYEVTQDAALLSGHGIEYETLTTVPAGTTVEVTKGDGQFVHTIYNGTRGYLQASKVSREGTPPRVIPASTSCILSVPGEAVYEFNVYCDGNLPQQFALTTDVPEGTNGFFKIGVLEWDYTTAKVRITAVAGGMTELTFRIVDLQTEKIVAANNFFIIAKEETATLTASMSSIEDLDLEENCERTITLSPGGYIPGEYTYTLWAASGDNFRIDWIGDSKNGSRDVKITAVRPGAGRAVFALVCNGVVRASAEVRITVQGEIQKYPSFTAMTLSSTEPKARELTIRFYGIFTQPPGFFYHINTDAFSVEDISLEPEPTGEQPLTCNATIKPVHAGKGTVRFYMTDPKTDAEIASITIPVEVVEQPVYLVQYYLKDGSNMFAYSLLPPNGHIVETVPEREHYKFMGWTDDPKSNSVRYQLGSIFDGTDDMTLYAVWGPELPENVLRLPEKTTSIDSEAFFGTNIQAVVIDQACVNIGPDAFTNCSKLSVVVILRDDISIDAHAFDGCGKLAFYGKKGSEAEAYASTYGYTFYPLD